MKIETKFDPGETVYSVEKSRVEHRHIACPDCNGLGHFKVMGARGKEVKALCPTCAETGDVKQHRTVFQAVKRTIDYVAVHGADNHIYHMNDVFAKLVESDLFKTKEAAERECRRRNESEKWVTEVAW